MERITFDRRSLGGFVDKRQVKRSIVADEDRTGAATVANGTPYFPKHSLQSVAFVNRGSKRVVGIDTIYCERCRLEIGTIKRFDMIAMRLSSTKSSVIFCLDENRGNLEKGIGL